MKWSTVLELFKNCSIELFKWTVQVNCSSTVHLNCSWKLVIEPSSTVHVNSSLELFLNCFWTVHFNCSWTVLDEFLNSSFEHFLNCIITVHWNCCWTVLEQFICSRTVEQFTWHVLKRFSNSSWINFNSSFEQFSKLFLNCPWTVDLKNNILQLFNTSTRTVKELL